MKQNIKIKYLIGHSSLYDTIGVLSSKLTHGQGNKSYFQNSTIRRIKIKWNK